MAVSAISFDLYQTLVNLDEFPPMVVAEIFDGRLPSCIGSIDCFWRRTTECLNTALLRQNDSAAAFVTVRDLFIEAYGMAFDELGLSIDSKRAAGILAKYHGLAKPFPESLEVLSELKRQYRIFLTSDADEDFMRETLCGLPCFDGIISSESARSYKVHPHGVIWRKLMDLTGCPPEEIVHIGDGTSDVIGAKRLGIRSVWLNRNRRVWQGSEFMPDAEIGDLRELGSVLNTWKS